MSCILKSKGKDFPSTIDIITNKGVAEIKSYYPRFEHVKESCKACLGKQKSIIHTKIHQSLFLENHFENHFWKILLSFESNLLRYSKSNFQKESPGG